MSNYIPPDSHNTDLNFNEVAGTVDAHNVVLSFGDAEDVNLASIDAVIETVFRSEITTLQGSVAQIDCVIATEFNAEISADSLIQFGSIDAVMNTSFVANFGAHSDLNFELGLNHLSGFSYQKALPTLIESQVKYGKARFKAHNSAFIFERGLSLSSSVITGFDKTLQLQQSVKSVFEETTKLLSDYQIVWQENDKRFIARSMVFEESEKLLIQRKTSWDEMIRKRKKFTFSHEIAEVFEKRFTFKHDKGLELVTTDSIPWDAARAVYYRKSSVDPIEPQLQPEYVGTTDLNFVCLCHDIDSHNVILNFGADDCLPNIAPVDWWYIVNDLKVTRLDNGQEIQVNNGNYRCDRSSWCWSYNLTIPFYEKSKLEPIDGQPVILKIMMNSNEHRMLLENISRSRQFAKEVYTLSGRSPTALLDAPYSPTRSFTQENERTSVQLVQAELDWVNSDIVLNWELIDELGWVLPENSLSYSNLTPIAAIKLIADAAGGFVYSEPDSNTLTIKAKYKKTFWDSIAIDEYDRVIPESVVSDLSTDYALYPDYNGVFLTNDRTGETGTVKRRDTAGDVKLEPINNPLFTSVSAMIEKGREVLAKARLVENHSLLMPITQEIGQCLPGELTAFNGDWWGITDGVSGSFSYEKVVQTATIERVNRE
ncbi:hypothetical protein [Acinetobacter modestus]|uniref:hypothetical protein n=1 Tax=Acinetobacter modestus TaxID=1776740 RepID=UPI003015F310